MARYDLDGRVALVTGGAKGIGRACCDTLAESGARIAIVDWNVETAERAAAELAGAGAETRTFEVDVADPAAVAAAVGEVVRAFGSLDIAVNNAGVGLPLVPITEVRDDDWRRVMSINLDGVFHSLRAELEVMTDGGSIVNLASVLGIVGTKHQAAYVAAKHGVVGLTKVAALEAAAEGVRVNAVAPGRIRTPLLESSLDEEQLLQRAALAPMNRLGTPREVGELVAWLASDAARNVTGGIYPVDGGFLAR
jgi:NAD(P)-dependent dehydrogenase (short-subunit alcohol dehydrogenase family)